MHSPLVRVANATGAPLRGLVSLKPEMLLREARLMTGLDNFGTDEFRPALAMLTDSLDREGDFHFLGRVRTHWELLQCLIHRLKIEEYFKRYPATASVPIPDPVVIGGAQRTGSTFLHRLLAADPANRTLRAWELRAPVPTGIRPAGPDDARRKGLQAGLTLRRKLLWSKTGRETINAIHSFEADAPEECGSLLQNAFFSHVFFFHSSVPTYDRWLRTQDLVPAYRYYRRHLQILTAGRPVGRLIVKHHAHLEHLDDLLQVFPRTKVVWLHRDAVEVIPSTCGLLASARIARARHVDPLEIGRTVMENGHWRMQKSIELRRHAPDRCLDVHYRDLVGDPLAVVRRIYGFLGYPLEAPQIRAFQEHLVRDRASRPRAAHKYTPEMFGLTAGAIREAFAGSEHTVQCQR